MPFELPPLPNFQVNVPPPIDVIGQYGRMLQLKNLIGEQKLLPVQYQQEQEKLAQAQLATQMQRQQMASQKAMMNALSSDNFQKALGGEDNAAQQGGAPDTENLTSFLSHYKDADGNQILPKDVMGMANLVLTRSKNLADIFKTKAQGTAAQAEAYAKGLDDLSGRMGPVVDAITSQSPDAGKLFAGFKASLVKNPPIGIPQAELSQLFGATMDALPGMAVSASLEKRLLSYHQQQAETQKSTSEAQQTAAGQTPQQETAKYIDIKQQEALGKTPSKDDAAFAKGYEESRTLGQRYLIQSTGNLSAGALDDLATAYHETGTLPQTGFGAAGTAMRAQIINHSHELFGDQQLAANSGAYKANQKSLDNIQKLYDQVNAFEQTAGKNLNIFLGTAQKVVDSGSPWINTPLRKVNQGALGSADMAAFEAARQTAVNEIAKVLNSSNASGVLSDAARKEISDLISPNATFRQITSAAKILQQDMANRHDSYQEQIQDIQSRMKVGGNQNQPGAGNGNAAAPSTVLSPADWLKQHSKGNQ